MFGAFLKTLRKRQGLTLREVQNKTGISNAYLSQIENSLRKSPHPEILKKLAEVYHISELEMLKEAGYLSRFKEASADYGTRELDRAIQFIIADEQYSFGTRLSDLPNNEVKKMMISLYEKATGRKLLIKEPGENADGNAENEVSE